MSHSIQTKKRTIEFTIRRSRGRRGDYCYRLFGGTLCCAGHAYEENLAAGGCARRGTVHWHSDRLPADSGRVLRS